MPVRLTIAAVLNLLLPGSGLILTHRHWLGFVMALLFTACGHVAAIGILIAPEAIPHRLTALATGGAAAIWLNAQYLFFRRVIVLSDRTRTAQIALCHQLADEGVQQGRTEDAWGALDVALTIDDEDLQTHLRRARLYQLLGKPLEARRSWRKVQQLDKQQAFRREMIQALQHLPYRSKE